MSGRKSRFRSGSEGAEAAEGPQEGRSRSWCVAVGLSGLLLWLVVGGVLESLHGFKVAGYLEDPLRREMWTLAHAHGTLLSLACIVLAGLGPARRADRLFAAGAVLLPVGFLLGGAVHSESDPGLGILLVPAGAFLAAAALVSILASRWRRA